MTHWITKRFGEVLDIRNGRNQRDVESADGEYPILGSAGKIMGYAREYICEAGTTIIGRKGTINSPVFAETRFWNVDTAFGLSPKDGLHDKYLYYFCQSYDFSQHNRGTTIPSLVKSDLLGIEIPLPPFEEQRRIVAVLDEAFAAIATATANAEQALEGVSSLFESAFDTLLTQGDDWIEMTVAELVEAGIIDRPLDGNHGAIHPTKSEFVSSGVPFVMASDLACGRVDQNGCYFITTDRAASLRKGFAKDGDILISHKGTIGRVAKLQTDHDFVVLTPQVTYYRTKMPHTLTADFLYFALQARAFQREMCRVAGAGSTRAYIGITAQLDLTIRFPSVERQCSVVQSLSSLSNEVEALKVLYRSKQSAFAELKQSLLHRAFTGHLTATMWETIAA